MQKIFSYRDSYMEKEYSPQKIEHFVQKYWEKNKIFEVQEDSKKEKYYCLPMMPYPSGKLHMGHVRNYTISDVISRYQRMLGKNVLQPMGWDAFGLPAEEAAIKNNTIPLLWTSQNIKNMKKQLKSLGFSYDWSREITTCQPEYYLWEQWLFTKLYEKKLVYKKNSLVNWCPNDKTVLANEQVINGCCWRCQSKIIVKKIPQWFIKIRHYAEALYQDLKKLHNWPNNVKNMQKNWIGRTKGFEIILNILNNNTTIKVFTKKLDFIMDMTCVVISPCHKIAAYLSKKNKLIKNFIKIYKYFSLEEKEKVKYEGINTHLFAIHPITEKKIPLWIANFVLQKYGANAIASIPKHSEDDYNFAMKYNLEINDIIINSKNKSFKSDILCENKTEILLNNKKHQDLNLKQNSEKIKKILIEKKILHKKIHYKLQDWCVSRQRYWGAPIPMAKLKNGKIISIPEDNLPVVLPELAKNTDSLKEYTYPNLEWAKTFICGQEALRETDTFDTFMESSWYYARYTCPHFHTGMIDPKLSKYWLPVDQYIGGIEHAIMHLIYFRFYHKLLRDFDLVTLDEPVKNLLCQGMVLSEAFYEIDNNSQKNWIHPSLVSTKRDLKGRITKAYDQKGKELFYAGMIKMSKSKNNGVEPDFIIKRYGADTIRLFIMFAAPVESSLEWKESNIKGIHRFLKKLWLLVFNYINLKNNDKDINITSLSDKQNALLYQLHKTIYKVSDDISRRQTFNTAIAAIMELVNQLTQASIKEEQDKSIMRESLICVIKMLYPFVPHFCFFVWNYLHKKSSIDNEKWPIYDKKILFKKYNIIILQINGKKRGSINIPHNISQEKIFLEAKNQVLIKKYLKNQNIKKIVYIPKKIINFVI